MKFRVLKNRECIMYFIVSITFIIIKILFRLCADSIFFLQSVASNVPTRFIDIIFNQHIIINITRKKINLLTLTLIDQFVVL